MGKARQDPLYKEWLRYEADTKKPKPLATLAEVKRALLAETINHDKSMPIEEVFEIVRRIDAAL